MVIKTIVALNVAVFLAWFLFTGTPTFPTMVENFTVSAQGLLEGRYWTLLTSAFSHNSFFHLLINMYVLTGFGYALKGILGRKSFLAFYLIAGIAGSFFHALLSVYVTHSPWTPALGASGAIAGVILFFSLTFPEERLILLGIIPIKERWAALLIVGLDLWGLSAQSKGGGLPIGHGAHLGGALVGVVTYFLSRKKRTALL